MWQVQLFFKGNIGDTSERQGVVHKIMGFSRVLKYYLELKWTMVSLFIKKMAEIVCLGQLNKTVALLVFSDQQVFTTF